MLDVRHLASELLPFFNLITVVVGGVRYAFQIFRRFDTLFLRLEGIEKRLAKIEQTGDRKNG